MTLSLNPGDEIYWYRMSFKRRNLTEFLSKLWKWRASSSNQNLPVSSGLLPWGGKGLEAPCKSWPISTWQNLTLLAKTQTYTIRDGNSWQNELLQYLAKLWKLLALDIHRPTIDYAGIYFGAEHAKGTNMALLSSLKDISDFEFGAVKQSAPYRGQPTECWLHACRISASDISPWTDPFDTSQLNCSLSERTSRKLHVSASSSMQSERSSCSERYIHMLTLPPESVSMAYDWWKHYCQCLMLVMDNAILVRLLVYEACINLYAGFEYSMHTGFESSMSCDPREAKRHQVTKSSFAVIASRARPWHQLALMIEGMPSLLSRLRLYAKIHMHA